MNSILSCVTLRCFSTHAILHESHLLLMPENMETSAQTLCPVPFAHWQWDFIFSTGFCRVSFCVGANSKIWKFENCNSQTWTKDHIAFLNDFHHTMHSWCRHQICSFCVVMFNTHMLHSTQHCHKGPCYKRRHNKWLQTATETSKTLTPKK